MPSCWQKKYALLFPLPQKEKELLRNLEKIKLEYKGERKQEMGAGKMKKGKKQNGNQVLWCIPKKPEMRNSVSFVRLGGMHLVNNMLECHKYGKDGNANSSAGKKGNPDKKGKEQENYVQLKSKIKKPKKKLSHVSGSKKRYKSDSRSNSE